MCAAAADPDSDLPTHIDHLTDVKVCESIMVHCDSVQCRGLFMDVKVSQLGTCFLDFLAFLWRLFLLKNCILES